MAKRTGATIIAGNGDSEIVSDTASGNDAAIAGTNSGTDNGDSGDNDSNGNFAGIPIEQFGSRPASGGGNSEPSDGSPVEPERKRRGRKPGSTNATSASSKKKGAPDLAGVTLILASVHGLAAIMLDTPELALADSEAKVLSTSICEVMKHYPTEASEKALAWTNLVIVAGGIYGTRIMAIRARKNKPTQLRAA